MLQTERIIGFCITQLKDHRQEALDFVAKRAFLSKQAARDIVDAPALVGVYCTGLTLTLLNAQPFTCIPLLVRAGLNVISTSNSKLDLPRPDGGTIQLPATWIINVAPEYETLWQEYARRGLVRFVPFDGLNTDFLPADWSASDFLV